RLHAADEFIEPHRHWLREEEGDTRNTIFKSRLQVLDDIVFRDTSAPRVARLEHYEDVSHVDTHWVTPDLCSTDAADDGRDLGRHSDGALDLLLHRHRARK